MPSNIIFNYKNREMKAKEFYNKTKYEKSFTKLTSTGISDNFKNVFDFAEEYASQRVNEVLEKAAEVARVEKIKLPASNVFIGESIDRTIYRIDKESILKLKNNVQR